MEQSPVLESLVWGMVVYETQNSKMDQVEPEHILCGILKYSEISTAELAVIGMQLPGFLKDAFADELEQVKKILRQHSITDTTRLRHDLRKLLGTGKAVYKKGEVCHRSAESRRLFSLAAELVEKNRNVLQANHLLLAILQNPTSHITKAVEQTGGRFINKSSLRELQQFVQGFPDSIEKTLELSTSAAPQIEVVGRAIKAAKRKNIFMVCEAGIDPDHLLKKVIQNQDNPRKMTKVKKEIVSTGAYSGDLASRLNDIFRGDNNLEGDFSYINFLAFNKDQTLEILSILKPVLSKNDRHFIFAMGEDLFDRAMDTLQSDELFRVIWMHVLSESQTIPYQV